MKEMPLPPTKFVRSKYCPSVPYLREVILNWLLHTESKIKYVLRKRDTKTIEVACYYANTVSRGNWLSHLKISLYLSWNIYKCSILLDEKTQKAVTSWCFYWLKSITCSSSTTSNVCFYVTICTECCYVDLLDYHRYNLWSCMTKMIKSRLMTWNRDRGRNACFMTRIFSNISHFEKKLSHSKCNSTCSITTTKL